jgi:creatinine amidohydrolase
MLAFRPETVRKGEVRDFVSVASSIESEFKQLRVTQPNGFGWMSNDLNEYGAVGEADKATAAKGEACAERGADAFVDLVRDVVAFDVARLGKGPIG